MRKRNGRVTHRPLKRPLMFPRNLNAGLTYSEIRNSALGPSIAALRRANVVLPNDALHVFRLMSRWFTA